MNYDEPHPNSSAVVGTAFDRDQFDRSYPVGVERHYWTLCRNWIIARTLREKAPKQPVILEIGCGRGVVIDFLQSQGYDCRGVELAPVPVPTHLARVIWSGKAAEDLPAETRASFNTILLLDVLEHLPEPANFLHRIACAFPNACCIMITVPARQELWSNYDREYGHYRRYDLEMVTNLARETGAHIETARYLFHSLYLAARIQLRWQGQRETKIISPSDRTAWIHKLIASALFAEYRICPSRLKGSSILSTFSWPSRNADRAAR